MISLATHSKTLLTAVDELVDDRIGIIRHVREMPLEAGAPQFFHFSAQPCDTGAFSKQHNFADAGGASSIRQIAMMKAIGEGVERYCAALYVKEELPLETYESASFRCVAPEDFALYSDEQSQQPDFPYVPFSRMTPIRWTKAVDCCTGEAWHVPASMVYAPYFYEVGQDGPAVSQPISTGLACHSNKNDAAISALCEVIERDAFTITWQAMLPAPPLWLDSLSEENRDLVHRFERAGGMVRILNITLDHGIPSIMSMLMHESNELPAFVFAAASHLSPEIAVRKSLEELAHTRRLAVHLQNNMPSLARRQDVHVKLYTHRNSHPSVDFLLKSQESVEFQELPNFMSEDQQSDLRTLCTRIRSVGSRPLLCDVTTPDVGGLGLSVVRALIPGFHPLFMGHDLRALGGWRLWNVPQRLGYKGITKETGDNPAPHPFP